MKKNYFLLLIVVILFDACSSSDSAVEENNPDPSVVLIKKIDAYSGHHHFTKFYYDGRKIVKMIKEISSSPALTDYVYYTGNLITEIKRYDENNDLVIDFQFTYDTNDQLVSMLKDYIEPDQVERYQVTHNNDGTVEVREFLGNHAAQTNLFAINLYYFQNGVLTQTDSWDSINDATIATYENDNANNPLQNVTGLDKILFCYSISGVSKSKNNIIKTTLDVGSGTESYVYESVLIYNSNNYPTSITTGSTNNYVSFEYF